VVKGHVKDVNDMIEGAKEKELANAKMIKDMNKTTSATFSSAEAESDVFYGARRFFTAAQPRESNITFGAHYSAASGRDGSRRGSASASPDIRFDRRRHCAAPPAVTSATIPQTPQPAATVQVKAKSAPSSANFASNSHDEQWREASENLKVSYDLTNIPKVLDTQFEKMDNVERYAGSLKSSVIEVGNTWTKKSKLNILSSLKDSILNAKKQEEEKDKAFDLLDALSRSGSLPIACAELHVMVASTHCFKKSVMNTVVEDNINPIEKIERSNLLVASVIHGVKAVELLEDKKEINSISRNAAYLLTEQEDMLV